MTKLKYFYSVLLILSFAVSAMAQPVGVAPQLLEKAIGLFPEAKGPYEMRFKSDIRMHHLGFQITNYSFMAGGKEAGGVTRVTSIIHEGVASNVDVLARYDDQGKIIGIVNLKPWKEGQQEIGIEPFLAFLIGKDPTKYIDAIMILTAGLASGVKMADVQAPPPPPKDFVLDLRQKIFEPGATLPVLKAKDLTGKDFDTSAFKNRPLIMVFTSPNCIRCDDMINALAKGLPLLDKKRMVTTVYLITSEEADARNYVKRLAIKETAIAEPMDHVSRLFQVPFKPYILMFDKGQLKYNVLWESEERLFGYLYLLIEGKPPTQ